MACIFLPVILLSTTRLAAALALCLISSSVAAALDTDCGVPPRMVAPSQRNIFSAEQEQWLGDATADQIERQFRIISDPETDRYLASIAQRLLTTLPPTAIQFRVALIESPQVNGLSLAGGRIYLTRKLVTSARSEDEVAGVIAHEMGHILTHQIALQVTADMKRLLGVDHVGDRADVYAKTQQLIDARYRDKHPTADPDSDQRQDEADQVAVYAAAAAGYRPQAYAEFWDHALFVEGKTGSALSDFFGVTRPDQRRLRNILRLTAALPSGCGTPNRAAGSAFAAWHNRVIQNQVPETIQASRAAEGVTLSPPLRTDLQRLRFSRDGKSILAQDESTIFVLSRKPYKLLFQVNAEGALPAEFSPDSKTIAFTTAGLHTEQWSVAAGKLLDAHEITVKQPCFRSLLTPDARTLLCASLGEFGSTINGDRLSLQLRLIDVVSGQVLSEDRNWFTASPYLSFVLARFSPYTDPAAVIPSALSADGNTLVFGPGESKIAFDLRSRAPIPLGEGLKTIEGSYAFLADDRLAGMQVDRSGASAIFHFPDGKQIRRTPVSFANADSVTSGDYIVVRGVKDYASTALDLSSGKILFGSRSVAVDVWQQEAVSEDGNGAIVTGSISDATGALWERVSLPTGQLTRLQTAAISPDGAYLAMSTRSRGGVWDLRSGRREFLTRGFRGVNWISNEALRVETKDPDKDELRVVEFSMHPHGGKQLPVQLGENTHLESGLALEWKAGAKHAQELAVHDPSTGSTLWSRSFAEGRPAYIAPGSGDDLIFVYPLDSQVAKASIKASTPLAGEVAALRDKQLGRLIEIVDRQSGSARQQVILEIPALLAGIDGLRRVGDLLYLSAGDNRTLVYDLSSGKRLRQMFGLMLDADDKTGRVLMLNRGDELLVYSNDGTELQHSRLGKPIRFAAFRNRGSEAVVLTADQQIAMIPVPVAGPALTKEQASASAER